MKRRAVFSAFGWDISRIESIRFHISLSTSLLLLSAKREIHKFDFRCNRYRTTGTFKRAESSERLDQT